METTLAILMVLGIFVGIPAAIGLAIAGAYVLHDSRVHRAERARAVEAAEAMVKETTETNVKVA
jgi:flagellar biosynthesis component FlhA